MATEPVGRDHPVDQGDGADARNDSTPQEDTARRSLLARMAAGDRSALTALYEGNGAALFNYTLTLVHDRGDAEEVVQDTFLVAWRHGTGRGGTRGARTCAPGCTRSPAAGRPIAGDARPCA